MKVAVLLFIMPRSLSCSYRDELYTSYPGYLLYMGVGKDCTPLIQGCSGMGIGMNCTPLIQGCSGVGIGMNCTPLIQG